MAEQVKVTVGGKEFILKTLTLNDWVKLENLGVSLSRLQKNEVKFSDMRAMVTVALQAASPEDKSVTETWVGDNIGIEDPAVEAVINFITVKGERTVQSS